MGFASRRRGRRVLGTRWVSCAGLRLSRTTRNARGRWCALVLHAGKLARRRGFAPRAVPSQSLNWSDVPLPQAEHFLRTMETYSQPPCGEQADRDCPGPAGPEAPWQPGVKPPQLSGLQGSAFEDITARRSSDWLQRPSGMDGAPARQLATQSCWNSEPQFWHDILTLRLWEIFTRNPNKTDAPRHRRESPRGREGWPRATRRAARAEPCPPPPPPPPVAVVTEQMPGLVSERVILAGPPAGRSGSCGTGRPPPPLGPSRPQDCAPRLSAVPRARGRVGDAARGRRQVEWSLLGLPEASGSEAEPGRDPWADQITLFLADSKAGSQDRATRAWNRLPKTPRVTPVGGGRRLPEAVPAAHPPLSLPSSQPAGTPLRLPCRFPRRGHGARHVTRGDALSCGPGETRA